MTLQSHTKDMAESVIKKEIIDTGWVTVNANLQYRNIGSEVEVIFNVPISISPSTWTDIGQVPYKPGKNFYNMVYASADMSNYLVAYVSINGTIQAQGRVSQTINGQFKFATSS